MQGDSMTMINSLLPFIFMGGVFYFLLWRPQKQEQKKRREMLESLKVGDKVVTLGGMMGKITRIDEKNVTIKVAEAVEIEFLRTAVSHVQVDVNGANG